MQYQVKSSNTVGRHQLRYGFLFEDIKYGQHHPAHGADIRAAERGSGR
jgi:hypothetical protein